MQPEDWDSGFGRAVGVFLERRGIRERDRRGEPITDQHFIVLFNAGDELVDFHIPAIEYSPKWDVLVDTAGEQADSAPLDPGSTVRRAREGDSSCSRARPARAGGRPLGRRLARGAAPTRRVPGQSPKPELRALTTCAASRRPTACRSGGTFDLDAAAAVTGYLRDLGVDWAYLSPLLQATDGSDHGYDVVDPTTVDPTRGGRERPGALRGRGARGRSRHPRRHRPEPHGRRAARAEPVVVGRAHARARIPLRRRVRHRLGLRRRAGCGFRSSVPTSARCSQRASAQIQRERHRARPHGASCATSTIVLPLAPGTVTGDGTRRSGRASAHPRSASTRSSMFWRREAADLNYRRFFAVTTLAGVRVEDALGVRRDATPRSLRWVHEGLADGLRVDHPDGLADPGGVPRAARRGDRRRVRARGEDPRARRARCPRGGRPTARRATTPSPRSIACSSIRRARRRWTCSMRGFASGRAARRSHGPDPRHEAGDRRHDPARGGASARPRAAARPVEDAAGRPRRAARVLPGVPLVPACGPRASGAGGGRGSRTSPRSRGGDRRARGRAGGSVARGRAPLPADDGPGDGEGRRGHGVLPLHPARHRSPRSAAIRRCSRCRSRSSTARRRPARRRGRTR